MSSATRERYRLSAQQAADMLDQLEGLLAAVAAGDLAASPGWALRAEGAAVVLRQLLGRPQPPDDPDPLGPDGPAGPSR